MLEFARWGTPSNSMSNFTLVREKSGLVENVLQKNFLQFPEKLTFWHCFQCLRNLCRLRLTSQCTAPVFLCHFQAKKRINKIPEKVFSPNKNFLISFIFEKILPFWAATPIILSVFNLRSLSYRLIFSEK